MLSQASRFEMFAVNPEKIKDANAGYNLIATTLKLEKQRKRNKKRMNR